MALKEKIYWESMAWKATSMQEHSLEKLKANKAPPKKAEPHKCFPPFDKENVAAAYYNLGTSHGPCPACKSSAQIKYLGTSATRMSVVDSTATGARMSVDSLARGRQTSADSLADAGAGPAASALDRARRSVDSALTSAFRAELLARMQAHAGRRTREGVSVKPRNVTLGSDQYRGECKKEQAVKVSNVYAHKRMSRSKDGRCKNVQLRKGSDVYAHERMSGAKDALCREEVTGVCAHRRLCSSMDDVCKNGQWVEGANVYAHQGISRSIASGLYVNIRSSDMPMSMQLHVVQLTQQVLDKQLEHLSLMDTARALKKGLDSQHGYVWHCVVGASYGSYVTHSMGFAIYFYVGNLAILLFKTNLSLKSSSP